MATFITSSPSFCLPKKFTGIFLNGLRDGSIDPVKLKSLSSSERREFFAKVLGEDNAKEVNSLFESKLLLKNQKKGLEDWARQVAGLRPDIRLDIADQIVKMDRILQPATERAFLADLANKKLGAAVSASEAQTLFDHAKMVSDLKTSMLQNIDDIPGRIAYGRALQDLNDAVESMKPQGKTWGQLAIDTLNIPKSMLTSIFHFSAPFVQGWGMMSTKRSWEAFGQMFKYFATEDHYQNLNAYIISHPDYKFAKDGGLGLTALTDKLTTREEALQSTLVEGANQWLTDKTGIPNLVRMSSRAFTGYLNYVRFNRFSDLLNAARMADEDVRIGSTVVKDLAKVVNDFTGRGAIGVGDSYRNIAPTLNTVFFSPRKMSATIQMFNPVRFTPNVLRESVGLAPVSKTAQMAAMRQLSGSLIATGAILSIAKAMGYGVDVDPRSTGFMKIEIGGEKLDVTGGNAIYLRLLTRLATGQVITSSGHLLDVGSKQYPTTRAGLVEQYVRGKLSPIASMMTDALYGSDPIGRPFNVTDEARDKLVPITMGAFLNYYENDKDNAAAVIPALSAIFGVSLESPLPPGVRNNLSALGDPVSTGEQLLAGGAPSESVDKEYFRLRGRFISFPPETINGIKLNDSQYKEYIAARGTILKSLFPNLIGSDNWTHIPDGMKLKLMNEIINRAQKAAQSAVIIKSRDTDNDILRLSNQAKIQKQQELMKNKADE